MIPLFSSFFMHAYRKDTKSETALSIGTGSIGTGQKTLKQLSAGKITQRDLIINFRKPKAGDASSEIKITVRESILTYPCCKLVVIRVISDPEIWPFLDGH